MIVDEIRGLAERNGVVLTTELPAVGHVSKITATLGGRSFTRSGYDPDRVMVAAIEGAVWQLAEFVRISDRLTDCEVGWAFNVFDDDGCFAVEWPA